MSDTVISVENLSKKYIIGHQQQERYTALRDVMASKFKSLGSFINPKAKLENPASEEFWALKDVSFEIKQGDRVGIIGRNGAGKSTLLKILSRITEPTTGSIKIKGRVASLLEVGTGFHPELTGRENIFLNGAILGMSKVEIKRKFDEIVAFAEVEKFLDTPVKRYSSGMYVRLAFAVAAHLEPEILIVDEVLAVGDAQFQKKCLGKMEEVGKEGRTVLFVSHNMTALRNICDQAIFLKTGTLINKGETNLILSQYTENLETSQIREKIWDNPNSAPGNEKVKIHYIGILPDTSEENFINNELTIETPLKVKVIFWNYVENSCINFSISVFTNEGICVFNSVSKSIEINMGMMTGVCYLPNYFLNDGNYYLAIMIVQDRSRPLLLLKNIINFTINDIERDGGWYGKWAGVVRPQLSWDISFTEDKDY
ncbi:polysaccharide ABC transporter ATP-binding protein [Nodularia spumigena CS-591/12]|uniref:ABC transporter ATP-binding protein n=1 Tax=Nodularia spumigena TaxID=70799 RepID=UPI00232DC7E3|nr:polysaccharide ABC transporter ATP-binding protein [Nodularia spumigena]MDB9304548.1 polysaccharide ABC transporter ATP-binding protein [Nodularia spumigena CS-591/12]